MTNRVDEIDLSLSMDKVTSIGRVAVAQRRLTQLRLFTAGLLEPDVVAPGLVVLLEGFDAAGKGGAIRRLTTSMDPRHVRVVPIGPPTPEELRHNFLWRFQPCIAGTGGMTVFDRSWYGRLLVERVEGLIDKATAKRSGQEIVDFEKMLVDNNVTLLKFWLHISEEEQLKRFKDRESNPLKQWKLTPYDWRNREKRAAYLGALRDMVEMTDRSHAHWNLIPAESKHYARVAFLETLIGRWVHDLERHGLKVPQPHADSYLGYAP